MFQFLCYYYGHMVAYFLFLLCVLTVIFNNNDDQYSNMAIYKNASKI